MDYLHEIRWSIFSEVGNILITLLCLCLFMSVLFRSFLYRTVRVFAGIIAFFFFTLTVLPVGEIAVRPLENALSAPQMPEKVDGIVMLTGAENPQLSEERQHPVIGVSAERYLELARMASRYPDAKILISGGTNPWQVSTRMAVRDVVGPTLQAMGIDPARVIYESRSTSTHENVGFSKVMVMPEAGQTWVLITSAYHMPRAYLSFKATGWNVIPAPSDYLSSPKFISLSFPTSAAKQLRYLTIAGHEYIGLLVYRVLGWIDAIWV